MSSKGKQNKLSPKEDNSLQDFKDKSRLKKVTLDLFLVMAAIRVLVMFLIVPITHFSWNRKGPYDVRCYDRDYYVGNVGTCKEGCRDVRCL
jgi:hypothetical protein